MALQPLTVEQLVNKILNKESVFILDIRTEEDYQDWAIQGDSVTTLNRPLYKWKENPDKIKAELPEDQTIYVVCARGISSQDGVELLQEAGVQDITHLQGGMLAWSEHLEPTKIGTLTDGGAVYQFVRLGKGCLSYMIESNGEVAVVDANRMINSYEQFAEKNNWKVKHVLDTHLHADHISGGKTLAAASDATYWFPPKDDEGLAFDYQELRDGEAIKLGNITILPYFSPGHTEGSTSLIVDQQYLLTGDILFVESIGRPDLAGKADTWVNDLRETLYERYKGLADDLVVLPAHFGDMKELNEDGSVKSKISVIYQENDRLHVETAREFHRLVTDNLPPQPNSHEEIRKTNMGRQQLDQKEKREMEVGPNRCAV